MTTTTDTLPIDRNAWRAQWDAFKAEHLAPFARSSWNFGPKNFLADEVLGKWSINERNVELSEVTFTIGETHRYIGVTFGDGLRNEAGLASSFAEL